jgi:hypothetical protein
LGLNPLLEKVEQKHPTRINKVEKIGGFAPVYNFIRKVEK